MHGLYNRFDTFHHVFFYSLNPCRQFTLVRVVNVVKHVDAAKGSRYLLELELNDVHGQLLRLSHYVYAPILQRQHSLDFSFKQPEPQLTLCNPVGFQWNPKANIHFIVPGTATSTHAHCSHHIHQLLWFLGPVLCSFLCFGFCIILLFTKILIIEVLSYSMFFFYSISSRKKGLQYICYVAIGVRFNAVLRLRSYWTFWKTLFGRDPEQTLFGLCRDIYYSPTRTRSEVKFWHWSISMTWTT